MPYKSSGESGVRAAWQDAQIAQELATSQSDPPVLDERGGYNAGNWPGHPADRLPPDCPVIPLGVENDTAYFVDTLGQLRTVAAAAWSKKILISLFQTQPNYLCWAWPRWGKPKDGGGSQINGLETDDAVQCMMKAAAMRGLFNPADKVRGRGAWMTRDGSLLWHSGDALWRSDGRRMQHSRPSEVDGIFYPQRPAITRPWTEPVPEEDSPAHELLKQFRTWNWERPVLDPMITLGWIGNAFLGGALEWRPHLFILGDRGVGKSTLQGVLKTVLGDTLHTSADTTAAGIYQRVRMDSLPCALDEVEPGTDNRKVRQVVDLARTASSGAVMFRGGAEHTGVEFQMRNAFIFAAINRLPLESAEISRMAFLNLSRLSGVQREFTVHEDWGRMLLRQLMDGWADYPRMLRDWKNALRGAGFDGRQQDTYGALLAMAHLLLGDMAMEDAGFPITEENRLGELISQLTADERHQATDNWRDCIEHLFGWTVDAWHSGGKPVVGNVLEQLERGDLNLAETNERLREAGLVARVEDADGNPLKVIPATTSPRRIYLCVPVSGPHLNNIYKNTKWGGNGWSVALKQAPLDVVVRDRGARQNVKINRVTTRCLMIDMHEYDAAVGVSDDGEDNGDG